MAREPHYPAEAPIGSGTASGTASGDEPQSGGKAAPGTRLPGGGETAKAVAAARAAAGAAAGDQGRRKHLVAGAAIGIGSAAIVAALLYANRRGKNERG